jgi:hypothetical protein
LHWILFPVFICSGEAFVRQFLLGQEFFRREFGITCEEFWLPDTFGYSAQIPQILQVLNIRQCIPCVLSYQILSKLLDTCFAEKEFNETEHCVKGEDEEGTEKPNMFLYNKDLLLVVWTTSLTL